eukprot:UN08406
MYTNIYLPFGLCFPLNRCIGIRLSIRRSDSCTFPRLCNAVIALRFNFCAFSDALIDDIPFDGGLDRASLDFDRRLDTLLVPTADLDRDCLLAISWKSNPLCLLVTGSSSFDFICDFFLYRDLPLR